MKVNELLIPDLDGVPEDDSAEPDDADVSHGASEAEVTATEEDQ